MRLRQRAAGRLRAILALLLAIFLVADTRTAIARCEAESVAEGGGHGVALIPIRTIKTGTSNVIVFIHGLDGHHRCTFYNDEIDRYWFDLIADDDFDLLYGRNLQNFDIYSIDYRASFQSKVSVEQLVEQLRVAVEASGLFERYDHIWLIAHSLGGIAVKELISLFSGRKHRYIEKIMGVSLIGVPSKGSRLAELWKKLRDAAWELQVLADLFGPSARLVSDLQPTTVNTFLQSVESNWRRFRDDWNRLGYANPRIFCAYETRPVIAGVTIVPELYSEQICDGTKLALNAHHSNMVKPGGRNGVEVHNWLRTSMREAFRVWENARRHSYGGGETLADFIAFLQDQHGRYDQWTPLRRIEFATSFSDETSRQAAGQLRITKRYEEPSYLRILEAVARDLMRVSLEVSADRRQVIVSVR